MISTLLLCTWIGLAALAGNTDATPVQLLRVPNGGIQPQSARDERGRLHMIYFKGEARSGDVFYVWSDDNGATFSPPLAVNSQTGRAIAAGNVRGAHLAVGRNGRVHVAWMGARLPTEPGGIHQSPMLYTRLNDAGNAFEPPRNVIRSAYGLDGGGSVAADRSGNVYVVWHAPEPGKQGEADRRVWVARSSDSGKTFAPEKAAIADSTGACGCCGMRAFADPSGGLYILYRSASEIVHRDMYLLASRDRGRSFERTKVGEWQVGHCVMSTAALAVNGSSILAAWEDEEQIHVGHVKPGSPTLLDSAPAPGPASKRKHPSVAGNSRGETLLAWTEGMGWQKGGRLVWQIYDAQGRPTDRHGSAEGVPAWSLISAVSRPDGGFTIFY